MANALRFSLQFCATMRRLEFFRTLPALISLLFVIQACASCSNIPVGPGPSPPMDPPFDSYDKCIKGTFTEASREACFEKTIQANHLTLSAGTTAEQAFAKYEECRKKDGPLVLAVGPFIVNGNKMDTVRQDCFNRALH
jgi:hypothetical protein